MDHFREVFDKHHEATHKLLHDFLTGPAPKEEEMPIETLDMLDDEFDADQEMKGEIATERRAVARDAYMAALGGLSSIDALADNGIVQHATVIALETVRRWDALMAAVDAEGGE